MWIFNIIIIFTSLLLSSCLLRAYGEEVGRGGRILLSAITSLCLVFLLLFVRAFQGTISSTLFGGVFGAIFAIAGAPFHIVKAVAIAGALVCFTILMIRAGWECWNNLIWGVRNGIRNSYFKK
jgi:predicted signal transduction protein with EAL and GGDEF domain